MVILEYSYPRTNNAKEFDDFRFGYHARLWARCSNGRVFGGGLSDKTYRLRNGAVRYTFINMAEAIQAFVAALRYAEGTYHIDN